MRIIGDVILPILLGLAIIAASAFLIWRLSPGRRVVRRNAWIGGNSGAAFYGTAFVDERMFAIRSVRLRAAGIDFEARCMGPVPAASGELDIRIHAPDGTAVLVGRGWHEWPVCPAGHVLTLTIHMTLTSAGIGEAWVTSA